MTVQLKTFNSAVTRAGTQHSTSNIQVTGAGKLGSSVLNVRFSFGKSRGTQEKRPSARARKFADCRLSAPLHNRIHL